MANQFQRQAAKVRPADLITGDVASERHAQRGQDTQQQASLHGVHSPLARLSPRWRALTRRLRRPA